MENKLVVMFNFNIDNNVADNCFGERPKWKFNKIKHGFNYNLSNIFGMIHFRCEDK